MGKYTLEIARYSHDLYESLAPEFGYTTRTDTREFDPTTPNGKLMLSVYDNVIRKVIYDYRDSLIDQLQNNLVVSQYNEETGELEDEDDIYLVSLTLRDTAVQVINMHHNDFITEEVEKRAAAKKEGV